MSNTFVTPKAVTTLTQARVNYNDSITSLLDNFASSGAPGPSQISLEGTTGLRAGMLWYKNGNTIEEGQGRLLIYNGSEFTRNGINSYKAPSIAVANSAVAAGAISYGEFVFVGTDELYFVNTANTGVVPVTQTTAPNSELLDGLNSTQFLRSDAADTMSEKLTISSNLSVSQNIGIGVLNPTNAIDIEKDSIVVSLNDTNASLEGSVDAYLLFEASGTAHGDLGFVSTTSGTMSVRNRQGNVVIAADTNDAHLDSRIFLQVDGATGAILTDDLKFGINTTDPDSRLTVINTTSDTAVRITQQGTGLALLVEDSANPDSTPFVIAANGFVGIGKLSPSYALDVSGDVYVDGDVTSTSDERLKSNVSPLTNALTTVKKLQGVSFTKKDSGKNSIGLIAQQVEKILPDLVSRDGEFKSIAYQNIVALLIEAIKEQQQRIERLESGR